MSRTMGRFTQWCSPPAIILALLLSGCSPPPVDSHEEETAVRAVWDALATAIEAEDWDAFSGLWIQDATAQIVHPAQGIWLNGWDEVSAVYLNVVSAGSRLEFQTTRLEVSIGDLGRTAWAVGEVITTTAGSSETSWQMAALRKVGDSWKFASAFAAPVEPGLEP